MELFFATSGVKHAHDSFVTQAQGRYFPFVRKVLDKKGNYTGEEQRLAIQGQLRPMMIWRYAFPEESLPEVLTMFDIDKNGGHIHPKPLKFLRDLLVKCAGVVGLQPIPKYEAVPTIQVPREGVALYPIGIKKDKRSKWMDVPQPFEQENL